MTQKELQKRYDILFEKIKQVRRWQREWKKYHSEPDRQMVLMRERELDNLITEEAKNKRKNHENYN
jgi:hypothetical protein